MLVSGFAIQASCTVLNIYNHNIKLKIIAVKMLLASYTIQYDFWGCIL